MAAIFFYWLKNPVQYRLNVGMLLFYMMKHLTKAILYEIAAVIKLLDCWHYKCKYVHESVKHSKKQYAFSKTALVVADVIAKIRSMQSLTAEEELVYLIQVKNIPKEAAEKIIENRSQIRKII